ncbi:MAG: glycosyltransferase family 2 protein [Candidatus Nitrotoga sp.]
MNSELISIVMATYNGEKYLRQQLDSILAQTYQHFELIAVDDASTDRTLSILNQYAALDNRIHVFPAENNLGFVANFERGLRLARGEFIALSDQDDVFHKDKIEILLTVLRDQPNRDLVVSDLSLIDQDGNEIAPSMWLYQRLNPKQGKPFRRLLRSNFATGCAMMLRRGLLNIALPFPPDCLVHDWWLAVVSASSKAGGICLVSEQLTAYRQHGSNVIGAKAASNITVENIIARIQSSHRGISVEARRKLWKQHIAMLDGYLRRDFWSLGERRIIVETKNVFEDFLTDAHSNLLRRIVKIPRRVRYAATTGRVLPCILAVFGTIWPSKQHKSDVGKSD